MSDEQWDSVEEFESFEDAYQRGIREGRRLQGLDNSVRAAEEALDAQGWRYLDMTGQDAEAPIMDELYSNLIHARDERLRETDPERYAEMKHFEAAARYLP